MLFVQHYGIFTTSLNLIKEFIFKLALKKFTVTMTRLGSVPKNSGSDRLEKIFLNLILDRIASGKIFWDSVGLGSRKFWLDPCLVPARARKMPAH